MIAFSCRPEPVPDDLTKYGECNEYSCPMHPDRTSTEPAACPDCRMDMRPMDTVPDVIRPE